MTKISAVYQIINEVTGDRYVGSSKHVKRRWSEHKRPYSWNQLPNSPLYLDMQKYGVDKFRFQILAPVEQEYLTQAEQEFMDLLHPTYNNHRAKGFDVERRKRYRQSEKEKSRKSQKKYANQLCSYNGETLTLDALSKRFRYVGIEHPTLEAKKYLIK